jgi:hypothetical protein
MAALWTNHWIALWERELHHYVALAGKIKLRETEAQVIMMSQLYVVLELLAAFALFVLALQRLSSWS